MSDESDTTENLSKQLQQFETEIQNQIKETRERSKAKITENHTDIEEIKEELIQLQEKIEVLKSQVDTTEIDESEINLNPQNETDIYTTLDDHHKKLNTLAHHINKINTKLSKKQIKIEELRKLTNIKIKALNHSVSRIYCKDCNTQLTLSKLDSVHCPQCKEKFTTLSIKKRFFRSNIGYIYTENTTQEIH